MAGVGNAALEASEHPWQKARPSLVAVILTAASRHRTNDRSNSTGDFATRSDSQFFGRSIAI
jgi:hypothetical protein